MEGLESFLDLSKMRDKALSEVRIKDLHDDKWVCRRYGIYFNAALILGSNVAHGGRNPSYAYQYVYAVAAEEHPEALEDEDDAF